MGESFSFRTTPDDWQELQAELHRLLEHVGANYNHMAYDGESVTVVGVVREDSGVKGLEEEKQVATQAGLWHESQESLAS